MKIVELVVPAIGVGQQDAGEGLDTHDSIISGTAVFPTMTAPAARSLRTTSASLFLWARGRHCRTSSPPPRRRRRP